MIVWMLLALAEGAAPFEVKQGVYDVCSVTLNGQDLGRAPASPTFSITIHEIKNYTQAQVSGRFEERAGNKVHWLSGPLAGKPDGEFIGRPGQAPQLRFTAPAGGGSEATLVCTWTQE